VKHGLQFLRNNCYFYFMVLNIPVILAITAILVEILRNLNLYLKVHLCLCVHGFDNITYLKHLKDHILVYILLSVEISSFVVTRLQDFYIQIFEFLLV
jgi:hypothetical protein